MDALAEFLNGQEGTFALAVAAVGGVCALICAFLPAPTDASSGLYKVAYKLLNWAGMNLGKAKNADDVAAQTKAAEKKE